MAFKKVLIIDDDEDDRKLIKKYLSDEDKNLEFCMATSGEAGIEEVKNRRPDLIVLDVCMPGIDGFETCKRIKEIDNNIKVIMLTGATESFDARKGQEAGAEIYTTKDIMALTLKKAFIKLNQ